MTKISLPCLSALGLAFFGALISSAYCQEEPLSIHQKAATCFEDGSAVFVDEPTNCDDVCLTCHSSRLIEKVAGQSENPKGTRTNEAFPGLYASQSVDPWTQLPVEHQSCRLCHTDYAETEGNHPIFKELGSDMSAGDLLLFDGIMLCATCHDPHEIEVGLLRKSNVGSALCLTCHLM